MVGTQVPQVRRRLAHLSQGLSRLSTLYAPGSQTPGLRWFCPTPASSAEVALRPALPFPNAIATFLVCLWPAEPTTTLGAPLRLMA